MADGNLPPEILYRICADIVVEYVDYAITLPSTKRSDEDQRRHNPIIPLLAVNHAFRASTRKVLSDVLGIPQDDDGRLVTKPWTMISRIQVLWRYAHSSKLEEFNNLARALTKYCGGPSSSPLVRSYLMLSAVGLLIAESVVPTIHNVEDLEGNYFDNPALEAYQHALEIQPRILAQCISPRIQQYLWTFYIGDQIITELERLGDAQSILFSDQKGTLAYEDAFTTLLDAMTKLRDVMKLDDNPHVAEWGPFPGPSSLLPEFLKDVRRLAKPFFLLPTSLSDQEDQEKKEKLMLDLYEKWEPFAAYVFHWSDNS